MRWNVDPILVSFAGIDIHWYGLMFAMAIMSGFQVMKWIFSQENRPIEALDTLLIYAVAGIIIGARLGHCLFYDPGYYLAHPLEILAVWKGGLASHGGGLGVIIATWWFCKKQQFELMWLLDRLAIASALFGVFVRLANFVNSEIVGIPTDSSLAVIFPTIDELARHPAQLYEAFSYLLIFISLMWVYTKTSLKQSKGGLLGLFLILVFSARFAVEFVKTRQASYGSELLLNTGQWLSLPFFVVGVWLLVMAIRNRQQA